MKLKTNLDMPLDESGKHMEPTKELVEAVQGIWKVSNKRTRYLQSNAAYIPVQELIERAYIQGMVDAGLSIEGGTE